MKKIIALVIAILMIIFSLNVAFAADKAYYLDELEIELSIPEGFSVVTRDIADNDPALKRFGKKKSELVSLMKKNYFYLVAIYDTENVEINVMMSEENLTDYNTLNDAQLNAVAQKYAETYNLNGIDIKKADTFKNPQMKFIRLEYSDTKNNAHGAMYLTVFHGKTMSFNIRSYGKNLSSEQDNNIRRVMGSIKYIAAAEKKQEEELAKMPVYADEEAEVTFKIPTKWKQEDFSEDREFIDAKFVANDNKGTTIIYMSQDAWAQMPEEEQQNTPRAKINNSTFTKSEVADMFDVSIPNLSTVTYNGTQYYRGETTQTTTVGNKEVSVTITQMMHVRNGWIYLFQFSGSRTHELYSDFETLLETVEYPEPLEIKEEPVPSNTQEPEIKEEKEEKGTSIGGIILLVVIVIGIVAAIIVYKKVAAKEKEE